jgi:hypothetical protein
VVGEGKVKDRDVLGDPPLAVAIGHDQHVLRFVDDPSCYVGVGVASIAVHCDGKPDQLVADKVTGCQRRQF